MIYIPIELFIPIKIGAHDSGIISYPGQKYDYLVTNKYSLIKYAYILYRMYTHELSTNQQEFFSVSGLANQTANQIDLIEERISQCTGVKPEIGPSKDPKGLTYIDDSHLDEIKNLNLHARLYIINSPEIFQSRLIFKVDTNYTPHVDVDLPIKKVNFNGKGVEDAEFTVEGMSNVHRITGGFVGKDGKTHVSSVTDGEIKDKSITITPENFSTHQFKLKFTEVSAPLDCATIPSIEVTVHFNEKGTVTSIETNPNNGLITWANSTLKIKEPPIVKLRLKKQDPDGRNIPNTTLIVNGSSGVKGMATSGTAPFSGKSVEVSNGSNGIFPVVLVEPENYYVNNGGNFTITLQEKKHADGYLGFDGTVKLTVYFDKSGAVTQVVSDSKNIVPSTESGKDIDIVVINEPTVKLNFKKVNLAGQGLANAQLKIEKVSGVKGFGLDSSDNNEYQDTSESVTSDANGNFPVVHVVPEKFGMIDDVRNFTIKVTEIKTPDGFFPIDKPIELKVWYDADGTVSEVENLTTGTDRYIPDVKGDNVIIKLKNEPIVKLPMMKTDMNGKGLNDATIYVSSNDNVKSLKVDPKYWTTSSDDKAIAILTSTTVNGKNGVFGDLAVQPENFETGEFKLKVYEFVGPQGYETFDGEILLTVKFDKNGNVTSIESDREEIIPSIPKFSGDNVTIVMKNEPKAPVKLSFEKQDLTQKKLDGAEIKISKGDNVRSINKADEDGTITLTSDNSGQFKIDTLNEIEVNTTSFKKGKFTLLVKEIKAPAKDGEKQYNKLNKTVELEVTYETNGNNIGKVIKVTNKTPGTENLIPDVNGDKVAIVIKNEEVKPDEFKLSLVKQATDKTNRPIEGTKIEVGIDSSNQVVESLNGSQKVTLTSDKFGEFGEISVKLKDTNNNNRKEIRLYVREIEATSGHKPFSDTITLTITYSDHKIYNIDSSNTTIIPKPTISSNGVDTGDLSIIIKNEPVMVDLSVIKTAFDDNNNTPISGATFKVEKVDDGNVYSINDKDSDEFTTGNSQYNIKIYPDKFGKNETERQFKIKLTETKAPTGYELLDPIVLIVKYDENGKVVNISEDTTQTNTGYVKNGYITHSSTVTYIREPHTLDLSFIKQDLAGNEIYGAKIKITKGDNVSSVSESELIIDSKNSNKIQIETENYNTGTFKLYVEEIKAPHGYDGTDEKGNLNATLTVTYNKKTGEITSVTSSNTSFIPNVKASSTVKVTIKNRPVIKLQFTKEDLDGNVLEGAEITVSKGDNVKTLNEKDSSVKLTSNSGGNFGEVEITPESYNTNTFNLKVKEIKSANGTEAFPGTIELKVTYDKNTGNITNVENLTEGNNPVHIPNVKGSSNVIVRIRNRSNDIKSPIKLRFKKVDMADKRGLGGATITITSNDLEPLDGQNTFNVTLTSDYDGEFYKDGKDVEFMPKDSAWDAKKVVLTVKEIKAPDGHKVIDGDITITVVLDDKGNVTSITPVVSNSKFNDYVKTELDNNTGITTIKIKNDSLIEKLTLNKISSLNNKGLSGVKFDIEMENVLSVDGKDYTDKITATTDSNGSLPIKNIYPKDLSKDIILKFTETEAPKGGNGYYYAKFDGYVQVTLKYISNGTNLGSFSYNIEYYDENGNLKENSSTGAKGENNVLSNTGLTGYTVPADGNKVEFTVKNQPLIKLSGMVWLDGQSGLKNVKGPDGKNNNEEKGIDGVQVELYSMKDKKVIKETKTTTTANGKGTYIFENIPMTDEGYKVLFGYDGINYIETKATSTDPNYGTDSDADELSNDRSTFNNKFKTISNNSKTLNNGESNDGTPLKYNHYDASNKNDPGYFKNEVNNNFILNAKIDGTNVANGQSSFRMYAHAPNTSYTVDPNKSNVYDKTTENIDCGLVEKQFDLELGTDVKSARLDINGKSVTYKYEEIMDGEMDDVDLHALLDGESSNNQDDPYCFYLDKSDYNYRIKDYLTDTAIDNTVNPEDNDTDKNNDNKADFDVLQELDAFVTYSIFLTGNSTQTATVDEFVYYYDANYTPCSFVIGGNSYSIGKGETEIKDRNSTFKVAIDNTNKKMTFTSDAGVFHIAGPNYRVEVDIEFKVNKNSDGSVLIDKSCSNVGEITRYSTDAGGLIDMDSAPNNANVSSSNGTPIIGNDEDDSYTAKGIKILVRDNGRTIRGTVFEDKNNNGLNDDGTPASDVIVQLIEIKKYANIYHEFIWQETTSGSNKVKTTDKTDGWLGDTYTNSVTKDSKYNYEFKDFIPGQYIIRYIYGDGTTYDINAGEYNGQDYKSTIDKNYNVSWFNWSIDKNVVGDNIYSENSSVARDNEARRLEVMQHSSTIDGTIGTALETYINNTEYDNLTAAQKEDVIEYYNTVAVEQFNDTTITNLVKNRLKSIFKIETDGTLVEISDISQLTEDLYNNIKKYVSYRTWMCAETSRIDIQVDTDNVINVTDSTVVPYENIDVNNKVVFNNMNFGLTLRPKTSISLEKHITALKITPSGVNASSIVDANASITDILKEENVNVNGVTQGLATTKSTRDNRGFWQVATDVDELIQGANLEVEYTYVIKNDGDPDYLSQTLVNEFSNKDFSEYKKDFSSWITNVRKDMRNGKYSLSNYGYGESGKHTIGTYLGQWYYNGNTADCMLVPTRVEAQGLEQALTENGPDYDRLEFDVNSNNDFADRVPVADEAIIYSEEFKEIPTHISEVVTNKLASANLTPKPDRKEYDEHSADFSKTIRLNTVLNSSYNGVIGTNIPSYIAEITKYSNAAGRRDMDIVPDNLSYVHSEDNEMTLDSVTVKANDSENVIDISKDVYNANKDKYTLIRQANEKDEFWAESIIITKPTGEDRMTPMRIALITITATAVLGVGIFLIRRFALKK